MGVLLRLRILAWAAWVASGVGPTAWAQEADEGRVIDRIVAVIDAQGPNGTERMVIALSDLEFEAAVALVQQGAMQAATARLDTEALRTALDYAIAQRLEVLEADKVESLPVDEAELEGALQKFAARFESPKAFAQFLSRHEADRTQLVAVLRQGLRAARVLDSRIHLRSQVSEAEVRQYYDQHAAELGLPFEKVRGDLRAMLVRDRFKRLAAAEIARLRAAASVRVVGPLSGRQEESP
jgi:hypothetical protein